MNSSLLSQQGMCNALEQKMAQQPLVKVLRLEYTATNISQVLCNTWVLF